MNIFAILYSLKITFKGLNFWSVLLASLGHSSPLLPQEGWNPGAVRTMDQRHRKPVIREASWPSHITSCAVTEAEYCAAKTGTRKAWTTPRSQRKWRGQWRRKWLIKTTTKSSHWVKYFRTTAGPLGVQCHLNSMKNVAPYENVRDFFSVTQWSRIFALKGKRLEQLKVFAVQQVTRIS